MNFYLTDLYLYDPRRGIQSMPSGLKGCPKGAKAQYMPFGLKAVSIYCEPFGRFARCIGKAEPKGPLCFQELLAKPIDPFGHILRDAPVGIYC